MRGHWSKAQALVDEALPLVIAHGTPIEIVRVHLSQARLHRSHGRNDVAMKAYLSARERLSSITRGIGVSQAWATLASGLYFLGAVADATSAARRAVDTAALSGNGIDATVAAYVSSFILVRSGHAAEALAVADAVGRPEGGAQTRALRSTARWRCRRSAGMPRGIEGRRRIGANRRKHSRGACRTISPASLKCVAVPAIAISRFATRAKPLRARAAA